MVSVVISPLSFQIVFIWVFSLFLLKSLLRGLSILFIFSKNQLLDSLILRIVLLVSMSFSSALILVISFLLLAVGCLCFSSLSSFFKKYILLIMLLQLFYLPPFTPLGPAHPLPPTFPTLVRVNGSYI